METMNENLTEIDSCFVDVDRLRLRLEACQRLINEQESEIAQLRGALARLTLSWKKKDWNLAYICAKDKVTPREILSHMKSAVA